MLRSDPGRPAHPGQVFLEEVLEPLGMTQREAAARLGISYPRMNEIVNGKRSVTPETALRLARFSGTSAEAWLELQQALDLWEAKRGVDAREIAAIEPADLAADRDARGRDPGYAAFPDADADLADAAAGTGPRRTPAASATRPRRYASVRAFPLGREPAEDPGTLAGAPARLAMVEALSRESWGLAGHPSGPLDRKRLSARAADRKPLSRPRADRRSR